MNVKMRRCAKYKERHNLEAVHLHPIKEPLVRNAKTLVLEFTLSKIYNKLGTALRFHLDWNTAIATAVPSVYFKS